MVFADLKARLIVYCVLYDNPDLRNIRTGVKAPLLPDADVGSEYVYSQ